jgi:hypothetical protein
VSKKDGRRGGSALCCNDLSLPRVLRLFWAATERIRTQRSTQIRRKTSAYQRKATFNRDASDCVPRRNSKADQQPSLRGQSRVQSAKCKRTACRAGCINMNFSVADTEASRRDRPWFVRWISALIEHTARRPAQPYNARTESSQPPRLGKPWSHRGAVKPPSVQAEATNPQRSSGCIGNPIIPALGFKPMPLPAAEGLGISDVLNDILREWFARKRWLARD